MSFLWDIGILVIGLLIVAVTALTSLRCFSFGKEGFGAIFMVIAIILCVSGIFASLSTGNKALERYREENKAIIEEYEEQNYKRNLSAYLTLEQLSKQESVSQKDIILVMEYLDESPLLDKTLPCQIILKDIDNNELKQSNVKLAFLINIEKN